MEMFDKLPVEMQMELMSYLDERSKRKMRLVCRQWNDGVQGVVDFQYLQATLSDASSSYILPFDSKIRTLVIRDLLQKRNVLTAIRPYGVISKVERLFVGEGVEPSVVRKIFKTVPSDLRELGLVPVDPTVGEAFLKFPVTFENVTKFEIRLKLQQENLKELDIFLQKLSYWRKFPNLLYYRVVWDRPDMDGPFLDTSLVHSIYISLHNFLYTHRESIQGIQWDFTNLLFLVGGWTFFELEKNMEFYQTTRKKMTQVALKELDVKMSEIEGQECWDLQETLLRNQFSLTSINFKYPLNPGFHISSHLAYPTHLPVVTDLVEQNHLTLEDLTMESKVFSFFCIGACSSLKKLDLKGASIISTAALGGIIQMPKDLEEISLDFKFVFTNDVDNMMRWFATLEKLKVLTLKLRVQLTQPQSQMFPTIADFYALLEPPSLTNLTLIFDASTAFKLHILQGRANQVQSHLEELKVQGIKFEGAYSYLYKTFTYKLEVNRGIFRGF